MERGAVEPLRPVAQDSDSPGGLVAGNPRHRIASHSLYSAVAEMYVVIDMYNIYM